MMNREQHLLCKLAEEANEVGQMALKTAYFGQDEVYVDLSNKERLKGELYDLLALVKMLNDEFNLGFRITSDEARAAVAAKIVKVNHYADYSASLGRLHG